jgi:cobyrinic acid a,c-diamide synthase
MSPAVHILRLVIAATSSGVGKTTVTVGLIGALRARGLNVAAFKCGPDYLDPSYHARAARVASHNLDGWMMGREAVLATFERVARGADIAVIEGMMGLFDAATPTSDEGSTAEIAKWLDAPVLLVVDASGVARSIAAIAHGFSDFDPELRIAGIIANRVGSRGHLDLLREACSEIPVLGGLPDEKECAFPERHLGLFSADRSTVPDQLIESWARLASEWFDVDAILDVARAAPALSRVETASESPPASRVRIGLAFDDAFHFYYEDNLRRLESLGAEIVRFAPTRDRNLPAVDGLYFGGGYPEAVADRLAANVPMLDAIRSFAAAGGPIYGECGGLMYLSRGIRTLDRRFFATVGLIPGEAVMRDRLQALGYVEVVTTAPSILGPADLRFRGHQFRYSNLEMSARDVENIYTVRPRWGHEPFAEGYRVNNLVASYVHAHWASNPRVAENFVRACAGWRERRR